MVCSGLEKIREWLYFGSSWQLMSCKCITFTKDINLSEFDVQHPSMCSWDWCSATDKDVIYLYDSLHNCYLCIIYLDIFGKQLPRMIYADI